jgi:hypothetical protein
MREKVRVNVMLDKQQLDELKARLAHEDTTLSQYLRRLIAADLVKWSFQGARQVAPVRGETTIEPTGAKKGKRSGVKR